MVHIVLNPIENGVYILVEEKKEDIRLCPMTRAPTATEKSKKQHDNIKNATKNFDYTTIADRLRTVSWDNSSHPSGVVKPVYGRSTFQLTATAVFSEGHTLNKIVNNTPYRD